MIDKLTSDFLIDKNGNCWGEQLPDNTQIITKINEIIDYLNKKD